LFAHVNLKNNTEDFQSSEVYNPRTMSTMLERNAGLDSVPSECVPFYLLTERQREVLQYRADGLSSCEIASVMGISYRTVEKHIHGISLIAIGDVYSISENYGYANQQRITTIGLIRDGVYYGYLSHDLSDTVISPLSEREVEIVDLLLDTGRTNPEMAGVLSISTRTVDAHMRSIHDKFDTRNCYQLAARAAYLKLHDRWPGKKNGS